MNSVMAVRIGELADMGWRVTSQTEDSAAVEMRQPINWWIFALLLFFFFGIPAAIYLLFWLLTSKVDLFVAVRDGAVVESGDTWWVAQQEEQREVTIEKARQVKARGFWPVMWPSVVATVLMVAAWVTLFWFLFKWFQR